MSTSKAPGSLESLKHVLSPDAPGLVAVLNNRADLERAEVEHWYRIPVQSAPDGLRKIRWVAFYLTKVFGREKWSVQHWAKVRKITKARRVELLPQQERHPRAQNLYYRLELGALQTRPERNIDVECDGDTWHIKPEAAAHDNARNNFMEQRGWHVLRFNTKQLTDDLGGCVHSVTKMINRCGGLILSDDSVKAVSESRPDGWKQLRLF
ncbi:MAG: DUF559 domain-containing protein [Gemmataceae bacterium]|nr:DUF559 domain-containing protein [Gemmataceae bacterium]MCI0739874.1 DUF559 domain-containing protein [Gemmataceae bacterium]